MLFLIFKYAHSFCSNYKYKHKHQPNEKQEVLKIPWEALFL